jgi:hypothetical protein
MTFRDLTELTIGAKVLVNNKEEEVIGITPHTITTNEGIHNRVDVKGIKVNTINLNEYFFYTDGQPLESAGVTFEDGYEDRIIVRDAKTNQIITTVIYLHQLQSLMYLLHDKITHEHEYEPEYN